MWTVRAAAAPTSGVGGLPGDQSGAGQVQRRMQAAVDQHIDRPGGPVGQNVGLADLPGGFEPRQDEHQRYGQQREREAQKQRCGARCSGSYSKRTP